jgi:hypothetical protein
MRLLIPFLTLVFFVLTGCNSSTGNDDNKIPTGTNTTGNGGTFKVSGSVKQNNGSSDAITQASVKLINTNTSLSVYTNTSGNYAFTKIAKGSYTAYITKANFTFSPSYVPITVESTDVIVQTIVGTASAGN